MFFNYLINLRSVYVLVRCWVLEIESLGFVLGARLVVREENYFRGMRDYRNREGGRCFYYV